MDIHELLTAPAEITQLERTKTLKQKLKEEDIQPHNVEAEQNVIGAIFLDNEVFDSISSFLTDEHFFEPVHQEIYRSMFRVRQRGLGLTPITLRASVDQHPFFHSSDSVMSAIEYMETLEKFAVSVSVARDYARIIFDLAVMRGLISLGSEMAEQARRGNLEQRPEEQITHAEQRLYELAQTGRYQRNFIPFNEAMAKAVMAAQDAYKREGHLSGIPSGLSDLDQKLGGLHKSDLIILAGRPSMGKTALATNIAFNIASNQKSPATVGFFSLEMSSEQLASRILSEQSSLSSERIRRGDLKEDEFEAMIDLSATLENIDLYIDDTPAIPLSTLASRCRRLKRQKNLAVVIIDYVQLIRFPATSGRQINRVQEISEITQGLKALAKELDVPVLALSQLSRAVENRDDKRPQLADLRESGSIEQDADVVMFVYREEYYEARKEPPIGSEKHAIWQENMQRVRNIAEVIISKQRHGSIGTIKLQFIPEFTRFSNLDLHHS